jgi:hypothetical protein
VLKLDGAAGSLGAGPNADPLRWAGTRRRGATGSAPLL